MFTHLHVASAYSAHFGVDWPEELAAAAAADGATALALTDRDGLYGGPKHLAGCQAAGIDPILGVDLATLDASGTVSGRIVVLAAGQDSGAGYAALCRLISAAHRHKRTGVTAAELSDHLLDQGQIRGFVLLGSQSDVGQRIGARGRGDQLLDHWLKTLPAAALRIEITTHLTEPGMPLSHTHASRMLRLAQSHSISAVLTNSVRYIDPDSAVTADVLDAARVLSSLEDATGIQPNGQGWMKPSHQMRHLAYEIAAIGTHGSAAARKLLHDTEALADRCRLDIRSDTGLGTRTVPEAAIIGITGDPMTELTARVDAGLTLRYPKITDPIRERLALELGTIKELGFSTYFLTVAEVAELIRGMGIRSSARGSGASSLVNYALAISNVDPIAHGLLFERFLSTKRLTLPDIDIDVESARRHDIYHRIFERFGPERVTLMSMQSGYRARGAARDAGLVLGMDPEEVDQIAKNLWRFDAGHFREAMAEKPELRDLAERVEGNRQLDLLVDITERLDRLPRHISMHPCGVILSDTTLLARTPVEASGMGLPMSQFDKHDMDPMGLLKLDVLGVRMQSAMAYALAEVRRVDGVEVDLDSVPLDDAETFALIQSTHTLGCFQIESPGQRELIGKMQPDKFDDLITDISLFRPGPMQADMVKPFLNRRGGWEEIEQLHPDLEPILRGTHGIVVFHEQLMRILDRMTGCGLAQADVFRRVLGSAKEHSVAEFFRTEASARGYDQASIEKVWGVIAGFGSFGFCRAHGAAFAMPTYQSAWLKAHHPEAFLAGIWTHDPGMYPRRLLVSEARRMGIPILPLDVNRSVAEYRVEAMPDGRRGIRMSLADVKGVHAAEVDRIIAGRPYRSVTDLKDRARPRASTLESLAALGALNGLYRPEAGLTRTALRAKAGSLRGKKMRVQIPGQLALPLPEIDVHTIDSGGQEMSAVEITRVELDLLAIDASQHLIDSYAPLLQDLGVSKAEDLLDLRSGSKVFVAGIRVATQTPPMHGGKRVVFISIDDGTGCVDVTFFSDAQQAVAAPILFSTTMLLIEGTTRRTGPRGITVQATGAWDLRALADAKRPPLGTRTGA